MIIESSNYWLKKRKKRPDITDQIIEYCIINSNKLKDRTWEEVWNAISRIPPSGRLLKVVIQRKREKYKNSNYILLVGLKWKVGMIKKKIS